MIAKKPPTRSVNRTVLDDAGHEYHLTGKVGEGGQGTVCRTQYPNVLVKIARAHTDEQRSTWMAKIRRLMRLPLSDLPIARPIALVTRPAPGYVMELMEGLVPLSDLSQTAIDASADGVSGYVESGGLKRRFRLLGRLARVLAELHGRGMSFGDLSPSNVFVSKSVEHSQVWLIDSDNVDIHSQEILQYLHTPDYGAPEVLKREGGTSTLSDSWSFAVIAFHTLSLAHPLKGDVVVGGEPELEEHALRGELPWVDHATDRSNQSTVGLPRLNVTTKVLRALFDRCFDAGVHDPGARPSLAEWADAMEQAAELCENCPHCQSTFIYRPSHICPFCGAAAVGSTSVLLEHFEFTPTQFLPPDYSEEEKSKSVLTRTGHHQVVSSEPVSLRRWPPGHSFFQDAESFATIALSKAGLTITPALDAPIWLRLTKSPKPTEVTSNIVLQQRNRKGEDYVLLIGPCDAPHSVWRFDW